MRLFLRFVLYPIYMKILENLNKASEKIKHPVQIYYLLYRRLDQIMVMWKSLTKVRDAISSIGVEYYALPGAMI
jgi:hypothetical protein